MKRIFALTIVFLSFTGTANPPTETFSCVSALGGNVAASTIWQGRDQLSLPPASRRHLIGSLVKTNTGDVLLALGGYRTQHHHIHTALEILQEQDEIDPFTYQWLGELVVENSRASSGMGQIVEANETAGYYARKLKDSREHRNSYFNLKNTLADYAPMLIAREFRGSTWLESESAHREHLMRAMDPFNVVFNRQKKEGLIEQKETYRHYIGNRVHGFFLEISMVMNSQPLSEQGVSALNTALNSHLMFESLYLYLEWLRNDGIEHPAILKLKAFLAKASPVKFAQLEQTNTKIQSVPTLSEWKDFGRAALLLLENTCGLANRANLIAEIQIINLTHFRKSD